MSLDPIRLGSANTSAFVFQSGSNTTTDKYGIQTCEIKSLYPFGSTVFSALPPEGSTYGGVFGNSYLPNSFLLDFFEGAPGVEYQDATVAKVSFKFKRIDPLFTNRRTVSVDSILNYDNNALSQVLVPNTTNGLAQNNVFGFPDPTTTVTYSTTTAPSLGTGGLSSIYALPGSANTVGFPAVPDISIPYTFRIPAGGVISYWNGTAFVSQSCAVDTTFVFNLIFQANQRGWQLTKVKYDPIANRNFFAVEENWRNFYVFFGAQFVSHTP